MIHRRLAVVCASLLCLSLIAAQQVAERFQRRLAAADANYQDAVRKAENTKFTAVLKASTDRTKAYKSVLVDATKAGDFDQATQVKELLVNIETSSTAKERPANVVKFKTHNYAVIPESMTWHLASRYCEDMGGHLVCVNDAEEEEFVVKLCQGKKNLFWCGATDEPQEGKWNWVTGEPANTKQSNRWVFDNGLSVSHWLVFSGESGQFVDEVSGFRIPFICEWEK
ncbi:MAG: lectin-like protein [Planctomycetota bacterium]